VQGSFPPAYIVDASGQRLQSWRSLTLPGFDYANLYKSIRQDESWNSPTNIAVTNGRIGYLQCPANTTESSVNFNSYFAVVGSQSAWPGNRGLQFEEIEDDPSQTILLIEAGGRGISWAEPKDLSFEEAVDLLSKPAKPENGDGHWLENGFFHKPSPCRNILLADCSTI